MRLKIEQLSAHLAQKFLPIYLLTGEEPLLINEARDSIVRAAFRLNFTTHERFYIEPGFSWTSLLSEAYHSSLFADKQIIDLRFGTSTINEQAQQALVKYANQLPSDKLLLITLGKLTNNQQQASWFKSLDKVAGILQIWPINQYQLPNWLGQRLKQAGFSASTSAIKQLANFVQGNLLAAAQEIEKLKLTTNKSYLDENDILALVADSAHFEIFDLTDSALQGEAKEVVRVLTSLQASGIEAILVLWALTREIRQLSHLAAINQGENLSQSMQSIGIWEKRQPFYQKALSRYSYHQWLKQLQHAACIERQIKGLMPGRVWDELQKLALKIAGIKILEASSDSY